MNDLPEYVLEYILLHVSPYSDLESCAKVSLMTAFGMSHLSFYAASRRCVA